MKEEKEIKTDEQILREMMISELDTINEYEEALADATDKKVKALIQEIIDEEKEHFEEIEDLLEEICWDTEKEDTKTETKEKKQPLMK